MTTSAFFNMFGVKSNLSRVSMPTLLWYHETKTWSFTQNAFSSIPPIEQKTLTLDIIFPW